jgi:hypothetical protein
VQVEKSDLNNYRQHDETKAIPMPCLVCIFNGLLKEKLMLQAVEILSLLPNAWPIL